MEIRNLENELNSLAYHGRGIIIGKSADAKKAITAYFIMGRSENSRNRIFIENGDVNGDGVINAVDLAAIKMHILGVKTIS